MSKYLDVSEVAARLGISKPTAYRWVKDLPSKKEGRGRTFDQDDVDQLGNASKLRKVEPKEQLDFTEIGSSAFQRSGDTVVEERLRQLRGREGAILYREMRLNDPVIAAVFLAIENALRRVNWRVAPASENPIDLESAQFVDECLADMSFSFNDTLQFILTMLEQGHSVMEVTLKRRLGSNPPNYTKDPSPSLYSDNRIGWRKWAPRPTESFAPGREWIFDETGGIQGIRQSIPEKMGEIREIPIERLLLFRTTVAPANSPVGLALALDTPVPTPNGWTTMGDIKVGDKVYGGDGKIRYVTWKSEVWKDRPVYEISFRNGERIVADENHLWSITTGKDRYKNKSPHLVNTKQLFEWKINNKWRYADGVCLGCSPVIDTPDLPLPIDPYILGYWLGDGCKHAGDIAVHENDYPNLERNANMAGFPTSLCKDKQRAFITGLQVLLRQQNLLLNKHIPRAYLRAGPKQRLALVQGMMDSDGTGAVKQRDTCVFSNCEPRLIDSFRELVHSLGSKTFVREIGHIGKSGGTINGKEVIQRRQAWRVTFFLKMPAHRLERKLIKQWHATFKAYAHYIRDICQLENGCDTVCIEVDSPDHLFLVGKGMIPTHNSIHRSAYIPWWYSSQIAEVQGIGIERDLSGIPVIYMGADTRKAGSNSDFEQAKEIVVNLRADEQAGVVFPYPKLGTAGDNRGMLLELLSTSGRRQYDVSKILEFWDKRKALSMMAQFIMLGMEAVGSFALGRLQADIFVLAVSAWAENIAETINRYAIPRLFRYNIFPGLTQYPKIVPSDVGIPNLEEMAIYVNTLVGAGLLKPGPELERHLRQIAHLPQRDEFATDAEPEGETPAANDRAILRAARAALILNRLRLLQRDGLLTPEQANQMMSSARDELVSALGGESLPGGEFPLPAEEEEEPGETK